jgi:hypothetical protein
MDAFKARGLEVNAEGRKAINRLVGELKESDSVALVNDCWLTVESGFHKLYPTKLLQSGGPIPEVLKARASELARSITDQIHRDCEKLTAGCTQGLL